MINQRLAACILACALLPSFIHQVHAAESVFGFVYTTDLLPKGEKEIEQWLTWRTKKIAGDFNLLEGRTSYEYGISDDFQGAVYATYDWMQAYKNGPNGATTPAEPFVYDTPGAGDHYSAARFIGVSLEGIYRIMSPYTDPFGFGLYVEPTFGSGFVEVETKLLFQKNFYDDTLTTAFNFTYAPELRRFPIDPETQLPLGEWEEETDINMTLGVSYRFVPNWSAGFEFINEMEMNGMGFAPMANNAFYIGPSFHYGGKTYFVTGVFETQLPLATVHEQTTPGSVVNGYNCDIDFERYRLRFKVGFYL